MPPSSGAASSGASPDPSRPSLFEGCPLTPLQSAWARSLAWQVRSKRRGRQLGGAARGVSLLCEWGRTSARRAVAGGTTPLVRRFAEQSIKPCGKLYVSATAAAAASSCSLQQLGVGLSQPTPPHRTTSPRPACRRHHPAAAGGGGRRGAQRRRCVHHFPQHPSHAGGCGLCGVVVVVGGGMCVCGGGGGGGGVACVRVCACHNTVLGHPTCLLPLFVAAWGPSLAPGRHVIPRLPFWLSHGGPLALPLPFSSAVHLSNHRKPVDTDPSSWLPCVQAALLLGEGLEIDGERPTVWAPLFARPGARRRRGGAAAAATARGQAARARRRPAAPCRRTPTRPRTNRWRAPSRSTPGGWPRRARREAPPTAGSSSSRACAAQEAPLRWASCPAAPAAAAAAARRRPCTAPAPTRCPAGPRRRCCQVALASWRLGTAGRMRPRPPSYPPTRCSYGRWGASLWPPAAGASCCWRYRVALHVRHAFPQLCCTHIHFTHLPLHASLHQPAPWS